MYEWNSKWVGYNRQQAENLRDEIISTGGVALIESLEGYEMGSGPHFQGFKLSWIEPTELEQHVRERKEDNGS